MFARMLALLFAGVILAFPAGAAFAAPETDSDISPMTHFNRNLVDSVEKGCIYIWIMNDMGIGYLQGVGIGSGVIFMAIPDEDAAYALTNHHVAGDSTMLQIETWDHSTYRAQLVATEPGIDCSLIRIEGIPRDRYEPCVLGNSDLVKPGDLGLTIGAPGYGAAQNTDRNDPFITHGLHQTANFRVVSGRATNPYDFISTWSQWKSELGRQVMTNCSWRFVMESAINPGNSGGPLFNNRGEVIALNHAHLGTISAVGQHINQAIPINFCKNFVFQIMDEGEYRVPWMGIDLLIPRHFEDRDQINEFVEKNLVEDLLEVYDVRRNSPAQQAGLMRGDIIIEFDGRSFADKSELRLYAFGLEIGRKVPVVVKRGRREVELEIEVGVKRSYDSEFSI